MLAFQLSVQLLLLIAVGVLVWRLGLLDEKFDQSLAALVLNVCLPCMIVRSFCTDYDPNQLKNCVVLVGLSAALMCLWFGVGQLVFRLHKRSFTGRILRFGAMFTNFSFVGFPVVQQLYGDTGLLYFVIFTMPIRMVYYSSAQPLLAPPGVNIGKKSFRESLRGWFSPPVVAVFIGLALYLSGCRFPAPVDKAVASIGATASPLGMILCGITIGKNDPKALLSPRYLRMPLLRNLLMPLITLPVVYFLPLDPAVAKIILIYAALPVASMLNAFTIEYDAGEPEAILESAGSVFYSTLLCAVTIPLWAQAAELLF